MSLNEDDFYVVSRGDFSGSPPDYTDGEWTNITSPSSTSAQPNDPSDPSTAQPGTTEPSKGASPSFVKPARRVSVTELCKTIPSPPKVDKNLPKETNVQQKQRIMLESFILERERLQKEIEASTARFMQENNLGRKGILPSVLKSEAEMDALMTTWIDDRRGKDDPKREGVNEESEGQALSSDSKTFRFGESKGA